MPLNKTLPETQSVGQDNIGYIVSALVDFYLHKKRTENYNGGILCIDEIDASLHPNAQLRLFDLLAKRGIRITDFCHHSFLDNFKENY